jgi:1-acyl-sn-glycerol-3-phosphate acyltransferase
LTTLLERIEMAFKAHESRDARSSVLGFLAFNATYFVVIGTCLLMLVGFYLSPKLVGLYLILPYYTYILTVGKLEVKDGYRIPAFSKQFFLFRTNRKYLNLKLLHSAPKVLQEVEEAPNAQFLISVFPHGTASDYRILMDGMLDQVFPNVHGKIRTLAATVLFRIPVVRELALWTGCIDARRSVAEKALDNGRTLVVVPGGEAEQIRTTRGKEIVYLKHRKGFIKLAMRKG